MLAGEVPFKGSSIPSIMKKHLALPPPTFQSLGVSVPPQLEAVVRHSLEKEVESRIESVEAFLKELHAAMNSAPMIIEGTRETGTLDPNKTMVSELPSTTGSQTSDFSPTRATPEVTNETNFGASFNLLAGTVSSSAVDEQLKTELSDTAAAYRREKEEQERLAREASAREAEASRIALEEAELKRRNEEERVRREQQERDTKERQQEEKRARVALQAKELEDRLERLSVSMSPATIAETDTNRTQQVSIPPETVINSFPGGQQSMQGYPVAVSQPSAKKGAPVLLIVAGIVVLTLAGAGVGGYLILRPKPAVVVKPPPVVKPAPTIKAELLAIEGGTFQMGRDSGPSQERPAHPIQVQSFFMDKTEVTNPEYGDFVHATTNAPPGN